MSNGALCATMAAPPAKSRNPGSTSAMGGAAPTIASVMPVSAVMSGGIGTPGLTSAENSDQGRLGRSLTAPISVMLAASASQPVVSTSTTTRSPGGSTGTAGSRPDSNQGSARPVPVSRGRASPSASAARPSAAGAHPSAAAPFRTLPRDRSPTAGGHDRSAVLTWPRYGQALTPARDQRAPRRRQPNAGPRRA